MGFLKDLAVGTGLATRDTLDNSDLKKKLELRKLKQQGKSNTSVSRAGDVYDSVNAQRDLLARKALEARQKQVTGLSPAYAAALKEKLINNLQNEQAVRRSRGVTSGSYEIKDRADSKIDALDDKRDAALKAEEDDKIKAKQEKGDRLMKTLEVVAGAIAKKPKKK